MKRRNFIKLSLVTCSALILPTSVSAEVNFSTVNFDKNVYTANTAQVIMVFMYGGASSLAGNLSNIDEIKNLSQSDYDSYFRGVTPTTNACWQEAGGIHMEEMMSAGDMTLFRTCFSQTREDTNNKAHIPCTVQNQKGSFDDDRGGIVSNLAKILSDNGAIDENSRMPFVTLEGTSSFYAQGREPLSAYLNPVGLDRNFNNPYERRVRDWRYYTAGERRIENYHDGELGFDPLLDTEMNRISQSQNQNLKIKNAFEKRASLSEFVTTMSQAVTPDLGTNAYPNSSFADNIEAGIKILSNNPDTKVITMGTAGLGSWDDHNDARQYVRRSEELFASLKSAVAHLKAINKIDNICIMVFGEFGRNVNLNSGQGWDHGNLQNLYVLGGKKYFTHRGVVGATVVEDTGRINRLFLKPVPGNDVFEPLSIAATLYKVFGISNPEVLTDGYGPISL